MKSAYGVPLFLLFLFFSSCFFNYNEAATMGQVNGSSEMVPIMEEKMVKMLMLFNESKRNLRRFQICAVCTCCGGARGVCLPSPCCYAISLQHSKQTFWFLLFHSQDL
ncbi:hypothetical protein ES319_A05G409200v1 [Gossypium barbadense]|uniref:DUF7866 domain-containing protein n=3 Tax=Gossypium TaxID=3633 RepID=A0A2P5X6V2_GOSBA|nr:hypothetical protein ES319_A05G409200v1 [Gossypium barbadense]PPR99049.1 hypothetical protein GOBAR_AA21604 [Gossypium barbadense]TYH20524.1 hypothetical protein ES288_A05G436900v1 [Gossypium darwinii]